MDPVTGLAALAGISLASLASLRLKKNMQEGFASLPDTTTNYPQSVSESQSRYNMFSQLVNPLTNSIIPVGSSSTTVQQKKQLVNDALGSMEASFSSASPESLILKNFQNKFQARSDTNQSLYGAIKFCRDAGKQQAPFTTYNSDGSVKVQGAVSADGQWKFDEVCGVCLTNGRDEDGNRFTTTQGMVVDANARDSAISQQEENAWPYPRIGPALGTCDGAPNSPAFATTAKDLANFKSRQACMARGEIGGPDNCALCFESENVFSSVPPSTQTNVISLALQGTGTVELRIKNAVVTQKTLSENAPITMDLTGAKEGDAFALSISGSTGQTINIYGYLYSRTPRNGLFTMPLNLVMTIDDETGSAPTKTGGFYTFSSVGLDVAKLGPGSGKSQMRLRGTVPFTFVQASEFAAMDCLDAPFQTKDSSARAFSTDQPCFAKGSRAGNYNVACLQQRILDSGCTNAGTLYQNPTQLNTKNNLPQSISQIAQTVRDIAALDMVEVQETLQCSGRTIQTPCDPFIQRAGTLKFGSALNGTNTTLKAQAEQCLSFLYHNKGASETVNPPRVGPTYSGLITYKNNQKVIKNIYCLPEGQLNPDTNTSSRATLARIGDDGYRGKIAVEAIKTYLSDQLALSVDLTKNANTDPDRKAAIINCFGADLRSLPAAVTGTPTSITNPCGVIAHYVRVRPSQTVAQGEAFIEISQLVVIDKTGTNVAPGKSTTGSTSAYQQHGLGTHEPSRAIDGQITAKRQNFYISATPGGSAQFLLNLGAPVDVTKIIYITRGDSTRIAYRKNGIRLELLDANQNVINTTLLDGNQRQEINYLQSGAAASCISSLPVVPLSLPANHVSGLYVRFYSISDANPDVVPGNRGWGGRIGTAKGYSSIAFNDWNIPQGDACALVAKGIYVAPGPETLYLYTESDDGIYVTFNNVQQISNWTIHGPTGDYSAPINITQAGIYPFELRFYEWGGGASCKLLYRINDEVEWRSDLTHRFAHSPQSIAQEDANLNRRAFMYGSWIGSDQLVNRVFTLSDGTKVYSIFQSPYTKMVTEAGVARYYTGNQDQFNPASWNSYASAGTNYLLKFV